MALHPNTDRLSHLLRQLDAATPFAKLTFAREITEQTLTILSVTLYVVDELGARVAALEARHVDLAVAELEVTELGARVAALEQFPELLRNDGRG